MKSEKKYQTPLIEIIDIPDDIVTTSTFGNSADDEVIWPGA